MIYTYHTKKKNVKKKCYIVVCVRLKTAITPKKNRSRRKCHTVVDIRIQIAINSTQKLCKNRANLENF
jgi:hypothetical protein